LAPVHSLVLNSEGRLGIYRNYQTKAQGGLQIGNKGEGRRPGLLDNVSRPLANVCGREWTARTDGSLKSPYVSATATWYGTWPVDRFPVASSRIL